MLPWQEDLFLFEIILPAGEFIPIREPWSTYQGGLRAKLFSDGRRQLRRLETQGEVAFERCDDLDTTLGTLAELETQKSATKRRCLKLPTNSSSI